MIYEGNQTKLVSIVARKRLPRKIKVLQRSCPTTYVDFSTTEIARILNGNGSAPPTIMPGNLDSAMEGPPAADDVADALLEVQSVQEYLESESMALTGDVRAASEKIEQLSVELERARAEMARVADFDRRMRQQTADQFQAATSDYAEICWEHEQLLDRIVASISQLANNLSRLDHRDVRLFREVESAVHQLAERQRSQQNNQARTQHELSLATLSRLEAVTRQLDAVQAQQQQSLDRLIELESRMDRLEHRGTWAWLRTTLGSPDGAERVHHPRPK